MSINTSWQASERVPVPLGVPPEAVPTCSFPVSSALLQSARRRCPWLATSIVGRPQAPSIRGIVIGTERLFWDQVVGRQTSADRRRD